MQNKWRFPLKKSYSDCELVVLDKAKIVLNFSLPSTPNNLSVTKICSPVNGLATFTE